MTPEHERPRSYLITGLLDDLSPMEAGLVHGTLSAVSAADGADDLLDLLIGRVLAPNEMIEAKLINASGDLTPFAELVLLQFQSIACARGFSAAMRVVAALETLSLAGF